jgi:hypothetical protein
VSEPSPPLGFGFDAGLDWAATGLELEPPQPAIGSATAASAASEAVT